MFRHMCMPVPMSAYFCMHDIFALQYNTIPYHTIQDSKYNTTQYKTIQHRITSRGCTLDPLGCANPQMGGKNAGGCYNIIVKSSSEVGSCFKGISFGLRPCSVASHVPAGMLLLAGLQSHISRMPGELHQTRLQRREGGEGGGKGEGRRREEGGKGEGRGKEGGGKGKGRGGRREGLRKKREDPTHRKTFLSNVISTPMPSEPTVENVPFTTSQKCPLQLGPKQLWPHPAPYSPQPATSGPLSLNPTSLADAQSLKPLTHRLPQSSLGLGGRPSRLDLGPEGFSDRFRGLRG